MKIETEKIGDILVFVPEADTIDADNAKEFKSALGPILKDNDKILFDMSGIDFLDSSGCGALLSCLKLMTEKKGDMKVFGVKKNVRSLFELIRMHKIIELFDNKEDAITSFK